MLTCGIYFANSDRFTGFKTSLKYCVRSVCVCKWASKYLARAAQQHWTAPSPPQTSVCGSGFSPGQTRHSRGRHSLRQKRQRPINTLSPNPLWCLKWLPPPSIMSPLTHQELWTAEERQTFHRRAACCWWGYKPGTYGSEGRACSLQTHTRTHLYIIYIYMLAKPLYSAVCTVVQKSRTCSNCPNQS